MTKLQIHIAKLNHLNEKFFTKSDSWTMADTSELFRVAYALRDEAGYSSDDAKKWKNNYTRLVDGMHRKPDAKI